jgi:glucans biosynthesis protein
MNRRDLLGGVVGIPALLAGGSALAQTAPEAGPATNGGSFSREALYDYAKLLSTRPFAAPPTVPAAPYDQITAEQYRAIRPRPGAVLWQGENRGFTVTLLPGGWVYRVPVSIAAVDDGRVRQLKNEASLFDFGALAPPPPADFAFPFSGFSAEAPIDRPEAMRAFAIFQGATRFRAIARGQNFGIAARGLAIAAGAASGEEFPFFRAFWIERPPIGATSLSVHALLDSESLSGACRMTLRPGEITVVDVELTLFPRVQLENVGFAPMTSMFQFGPNDRRGADDVRAAVHRSDGLQIWNGAGEWLWRPVTNPEQLQFSAFVDRNPRGFGLLQRTREFNQYGDLEQRFERLPSLWVEPIDDWGAGQVVLLEIPTDSEVNDNIVAFWRPEAPLRPGRAATLAYRLYWCWSPPDRPPGASVAATRVGRGSGGRRRRFVVDFVGEPVADAARAAGIVPQISASPGTIADIVARPNPEIRGYRVSFELDPGNENLCELRMVLQADGKPVSETWLYRWTP